MVETFPPGCTKQYETIVNHWYDFAEPGEYTVEARLVVVNRSRQEEEPVVLSLQNRRVTVLARDRQQLIGRCEQLFLAQRLGGAKQVPLDPAIGSDYRPSDRAWRQTLLHVTDEVVLPYLQLMLADYPKYGEVVTALSYVNSPKVPALLEQWTTRGSEAVRKQAKESLARLKAASEKAVQIEMTYTLLGYPAGGNRPRPPLERLAVGLWGYSGASGIRGADGKSLVVHVGKAPPPRRPHRHAAALAQPGLWLLNRGAGGQGVAGQT